MIERTMGRIGWTACSAMLVAMTACSTADSGNGGSGGQFEEAALIVGCPAEAVITDETVSLFIEDRSGAVIPAPLSVSGLLSISAPGTAVAGEATGEILLSAPQPGEVTVVATLREAATESTPAVTYVDRCAVDVLPDEQAPECLVDDDCGEGFACEAESATCVAVPPAPDCTVDEDCGEAERCEAAIGACIAVECLSDLDCGIAEQCGPQGTCATVPRVRCELSECSGSTDELVRELSGLLDCTVLDGTPPASVDVELECATTAERVPVIVGCDLFGGPSCSGAFGAQVDNEGGWTCTTVGITSNPGSAVLEAEDICVLSVNAPNLDPPASSP